MFVEEGRHSWWVIFSSVNAIQLGPRRFSWEQDLFIGRWLVVHLSTISDPWHTHPKATHHSIPYTVYPIWKMVAIESLIIRLVRETGWMIHGSGSEFAHPYYVYFSQVISAHKQRIRQFSMLLPTLQEPLGNHLIRSWEKWDFTTRWVCHFEAGKKEHRTQVVSNSIYVVISKSQSNIPSRMYFHEHVIAAWCRSSQDLHDDPFPAQWVTSNIQPRPSSHSGVLGIPTRRLCWKWPQMEKSSLTF